MRSAAMRYPAFSRAVTLLSAVMAQLLASGSLRIMTRDGESVEDSYASDVMDLLTVSPDGMSDAHTWAEEICVDYLIDGNALVHVDRVAGRPVALQRLSSYDAATVPTGSGGYAYQASPADSDLAAGMYPARRVAHIRWPRLQRTASGNSNRQAFALSPVTLLHNALQIGLAGDRFVLDFFQGGSAATVGISYDRPMKAAQLRELLARLSALRKARDPLVVDSGGKFTALSGNTAIRKDDADLRSFQITEIGRVYGIPGPMMNQDVTAWGSGIETLVKIFYRTCVAHHIARVLSPLKLRLLRPEHIFVADPMELVRGDTVGLAALITATSASAQQSAVATVEEQRAWLSLPLAPRHGELQAALNGGNEPAMPIAGES